MRAASCPVDVIGVIDLKDGRAVHARGGVRERYRPVERAGGTSIPDGDPLALVRAYDALGVRQLYVADLDAILGRSTQLDSLRALARGGTPVWVDAGVSSVARAQQLSALGVTRIVVGLETLTSFETLAAIASEIGRASTAFSLDLRNGAPVSAAQLDVAQSRPDDLAARAADTGAGAVIVLDLARVGSSTGFDLPLIEQVRRRAPGVTLVAGGGVRGMQDLVDLASAGCDAALVGTALLSGALRI